MIRQYVVDAFAHHVFEGNPAAVCILEGGWPADDIMRSIAAENRFSETAFLRRKGSGYDLRWFTPATEIDLCGHATLASGFVALNFLEPEAGEVHFFTLSGELIVRRTGDGYEMELPAYALKRVEVTPAMEKALGARVLEAYLGRDLVCVLESAADVEALKPDMGSIAALDGLLVHATAQGKEYDCVSRSFAPKLAIDEDPVCGSGHCHIAPYWLERLGRESLVARQASERGGVLTCRRAPSGALFVGGPAVLYGEGWIHVEEA